jgi:hypothetical protein
LTAGAQIRGFHQTMPTRAERLADHFIKATGIAAVYVDGAGAIGTFANVGLDAPIGCAVLCRARGKTPSKCWR